jgi:hypothetical protein
LAPEAKQGPQGLFNSKDFEAAERGYFINSACSEEVNTISDAKIEDSKNSPTLNK